MDTFPADAPLGVEDIPDMIMAFDSVEHAKKIRQATTPEQVIAAIRWYESRRVSYAERGWTTKTIPNGFGELVRNAASAVPA